MAIVNFLCHSFYTMLSTSYVSELGLTARSMVVTKSLELTVQ